jgi:thiamine phosphate synthase YjbQ (UPF0047 family)
MLQAKLYCPDFSPIFGEKFANPFWYDNIDSQIWPILAGIELPKETQKLLSLASDGHPLFYSRKITLDQMLLELDSGAFKLAMVQALEIGREYGISNKLVMEIAKKSDFLSPIISVVPSKAGLGEVTVFTESYRKERGIAGVVIYPAYINVDILDSNVMKEFCSGIAQLGLPLKIDVSDLHLPNMDLRKIAKEIIATFASCVQEWAPRLNIIIAGVSAISELQYYIETLKWNQHIYLEFNHRTLGGMSPKRFYQLILDQPGFIQNWWARILFGSAMPTLEPSQMLRGWLEATESLPFNHKCLLRAWGFRNGWRIYANSSRKYPEIDKLSKVIKPKYEIKSKVQSASGGIQVGCDMIFQSFAVTQLISIQDNFENLLNSVLKENPGVKGGQVIIKSYHTTTSLLVNEHEVGNYLQLHYNLAEETKADADTKLHTVAASENRADFNFPDHLLASKYGDHGIIIPIRNGKLVWGSREHMYAIVTFGPREIKISADFSLIM